MPAPVRDEGDASGAGRFAAGPAGEQRPSRGDNRSCFMNDATGRIGSEHRLRGSRHHNLTGVMAEPGGEPRGSRPVWTRRPRSR